MTLEQLAAIKIGDSVILRGERGKVTQTTNRWFMVTWSDGHPEVIRRELTILAKRLQMETV